MADLALRTILDRGVLVARETARTLSPAIDESLKLEPAELTMDLTDVQVLTPSFFDELLNMIAPHLTPDGRVRQINFTNSAIDLSRYENIGRTYALLIEAKGRGTWRIRRKRSYTPSRQ